MMIGNDSDDQMISVDLGGLKLPKFVSGEEKPPKKPSPRKLVPTRDRTRARCVTGAHATACHTAVDTLFFSVSYIFLMFKYIFSETILCTIMKFSSVINNILVHNPVELMDNI